MSAMGNSLDIHFLYSINRFLKQVIVRDIQMDETWDFMFNNWLALDRGSRMLKATIRSQIDITKNLFYNFSLKSMKDLKTDHLWVSVFFCPSENTFTRAQRLSVAMSLLLLTMLTSLMFHGIPTDDPDDQLKHGTITISLSDIVIGIESGLIMFPINILIMGLFTRLSSKRDIRNLTSSDSSTVQSDKKINTGTCLFICVILPANMFFQIHTVWNNTI